MNLALEDNLELLLAKDEAVWQPQLSFGSHVFDVEQEFVILRPNGSVQLHKL